MKHNDPEFREYLAVSAAPVPIAPAINTASLWKYAPVVGIALAGLFLGLAIGKLVTATQITYPGTAVAAWMGDPAKVLHAVSTAPQTLQSTQPATATWTTQELQPTGVSLPLHLNNEQQGWQPAVNGNYLQGSVASSPAL